MGRFKAVLRAISGVQGRLTDRSGTSTGASQNIAAGNTSRQYFIVQNVSDTDMWIDFDTAAIADSPSLKLPAKRRDSPALETRRRRCPTASSRRTRARSPSMPAAGAISRA